MTSPRIDHPDRPEPTGRRTDPMAFRIHDHPVPARRVRRPRGRLWSPRRGTGVGLALVVATALVGCGGDAGGSGGSGVTTPCPSDTSVLGDDVASGQTTLVGPSAGSPEGLTGGNANVDGASGSGDDNSGAGDLPGPGSVAPEGEVDQGQGEAGALEPC